MADLAQRLEAAQEGSRELSDEVLLACGWEPRPHEIVGTAWFPPGATAAPLPRPSPTEDLQDAVDCVPEHLCVRMGWGTLLGKRTAVASIMRRFTDDPLAETESATPALALSAAIVRAKESDNG